jgi:hypothetical protein
MNLRFPFGWILVVSAFLLLGTSCNRKYGCPAYESTKTEVKSNGMPKKGSSSQLFSKKMRRRNR